MINVSRWHVARASCDSGIPEELPFSEVGILGIENLDFSGLEHGAVVIFAFVPCLLSLLRPIPTHPTRGQWRDLRALASPVSLHRRFTASQREGNTP